MSLITQIKAEQKRCAAQMHTAKKKLAKADANARKAANELTAAREALKVQEAVAHKLEQQLKLEDSTPSSKATAKKPVAKAKPAKVHKAKPAKKAAAKAKPAKVKAKAAPKGKPSRAAQGRREVANGDRPPIKKAIAKVLGKRVMHANDVYEAIKEKGQLPNSHDPRGYIGYLLSASKVTVKRAGKDVEVPQFERVHEKGRGFYKNRGVAVAKSAKKAAHAPKKAAAKPAKVAAAKPEKKAAPVNKDGKRTVTCKVCGQPGHNSKGHVRAVAAKEPKAAKPAKETKAAAPKPAKAESPKTGEKRGIKCGKCGAPGHNAKGHDRAVAKNGTNGHGAAPAKPEAKAEKAPEPEAKAKDDSEKSTDEILAEVGIDAGPAL
jgi:hypothetical protein